MPASEIHSPDDRIARFMASHHLLTLATVSGGMPHCASLFYAYDPHKNVFVVSSAQETLHAQQLAVNSHVAGTIALETKIVGKLQGVQFRGCMYLPRVEEQAWVKGCYLKHFPFAALMELELWVISPDYLKFTDNRLGFGKKLLWELAADHSTSMK